MTKQKTDPAYPRFEYSLAELEAQLVDGETPFGTIAMRFIRNLDAETMEESLGQLSPKLHEIVVRVAKNNIVACDSIIEEITRRGGYAGGWMALRDWARRQPWAAEAAERMAEIHARTRTEDPRAPGSLSSAEHGRRIVELSVALTLASTPEQREAIEKEIEELEARLEKSDRRDVP